jgi:hypothetical protein
VNITTTASNQWASRPDDQRYLSLDDLAAAVSARRELSRASNVRLDSLCVDNDQDGQILLTPPDGQPVPFTNWSFGQLASLVGAPAAYLRKLPAPLARVNLQYGLEGTDGGRQDATLLYRPSIESQTLGEVRAFTSTSYGRIWDAQIVAAVQRINQDDRWHVPLKAYNSAILRRRGVARARLPRRPHTSAARQADCPHLVPTAAAATRVHRRQSAEDWPAHKD